MRTIRTQLAPIAIDCSSVICLGFRRGPLCRASCATIEIGNNSVASIELLELIAFTGENGRIERISAAALENPNERTGIDVLQFDVKLSQGVEQISHEDV